MVEPPNLKALVCAGLAALIASCSPEDSVVSTDVDSPAEEDAGEGPSPIAADDDSETPQNSAPDECEAPHYPDTSAPVPFESLLARVVDPDGEPVAGTTAQVCGVNLCLYIDGGTRSDGVATKTESQMLQRAAFKYGDGVRHAQVAFLIDAQPDHDLGDQVTVAFPGIDTGSPFDPGATLTSAGVELVLSDDADVEVDPFFTTDERVFLAAEFPSDAYPAAASEEELDALFALGPLKTEFCPAAQLRLPNTKELPAGARVEFLVHGTDVSAAYAAYGAWGKVSEGEVTSNGDAIVTDEDGGIPVLGLLGVRVLP